MLWFKCLSPRHPFMMEVERQLGTNGAYQFLMVIDRLSDSYEDGEEDDIKPGHIQRYVRIHIHRAVKMAPLVKQYFELRRRYEGPKRKKSNSKITAGTRLRVFQRDKYTCGYCGKKPPLVTLHIDHVIPVSKGGDNKDTNLLTSCDECNLGKGAKLLEVES